jgi:hypothetical protein
MKAIIENQQLKLQILRLMVAILMVAMKIPGIRPAFSKGVQVPCYTSSQV